MKTRNKIFFGVGIVFVIIALSSISMIYFNNNGVILESDYNHDPSLVLAHCSQQKYGEENNWKTPDGKDFVVTSIGLFAMNKTHYIDNNLCAWIERPPGLNTMLSGEELKFYKQKLANDKSDCSDGQEYNQVLFKCVVSCEGDLVYNGNTDSCTTEFELKYHGFCNKGFKYQPLTHTCLAENNPDDGIGDLEHTPLKDPPRTAPPEPELEIMKKARDLGIDNVMEAVDSEELSFDEKREYIQARYEEDGPVTTPSLNIRIKDFTRDLEYGERPTFTVIETGYANPCTSPKLEVYLLKQEFSNDHTHDDLIYEDQIVRSCPFFDSFYPILNFWDESDFEPFPICEKEGRYLVVGDSGYERIPLEEYYCGVENEN